MTRALIAGLVFMVGIPLQVKHPSACDHAAPPAGMQWVCANDNLCDCHLAASGSQDESDGSATQATSVAAPAQSVACRVTFFVIPTYPEAARKAQKQGVVSATLVLAPNGSVEGVRIQSGHAELARAVESALQQWRFIPGKRVESIPVSLKFVLSENPEASVQGMSLLNVVVTASPQR